LGLRWEASGWGQVCTRTCAPYGMQWEALGEAGGCGIWGNCSRVSYLPGSAVAITIRGMRKRSLLAVAILALGAGVASSAPVTWELHGNRWMQVNNAPTTAPAPEPVLDRAERMIAAGNGKNGARTAIEWLRIHPKKDAPQRDRALMLVAKGYFDDGKRVDAFYYLDELMDERPESPFYQQALELQYTIADEYLKGYKRVFIWFPTLEAEDEAVDMLYHIQQRSPGSRLAEKALLRTADYYYANSDFDLAADAYGVFLKSYPRSPLVPRIRLRRAYSTLAQFRGTRYDATPLVDARAQLVDIATAYPEMSEEEGLFDLVRRIDGTFAQKLYRTADFYRRTKEPAASVYNYRYLDETFPNSPEAKLARERLKQFPPKVLSERPPRPGTGYAPATQPSTMPEVR
jgi:Outer membrane lipoprotein